MIVLGIDPGLSGAIAACKDGHWSVRDCPVLEGQKTKAGRKVAARSCDPAGMADLVAEMAGPGCHAFVEKVGPMPRQGVTSTFGFGAGYGMWLGVLAAMGIPYTLVAPQRWKGVMMDGMDRGKGASIIRAKQLFPSLSGDLSRAKDDGRAEALLICEYGRRQSR